MSVSAPPAPGTTATAPPVSEGCPLCGSPLAPDQDWCLSCGGAARTRLASSPGWRAPLVGLGLVIVLALGALTVALVELAGAPPSSTPTTRTVTTPAGAVQTGTTAGGLAPGASTPTTTTPGASTPGLTTPGTSTPGTSTPGITTPGTTTPGVATPGLTTPRTTSPGLTTPRTTTPGLTTPKTTTPGATTQNGSGGGTGSTSPQSSNGTNTGTGAKPTSTGGTETVGGIQVPRGTLRSAAPSPGSSTPQR